MKNFCIIVLVLSLVYPLYFSSAQRYTEEELTVAKRTLPNGKTITAIVVPGGLPPKDWDQRRQSLEENKKDHTLTAVMLPFICPWGWAYGCSATSAAIMAGYYDVIGYANTYTGPTNSGEWFGRNFACPGGPPWGQVVYPGATCDPNPLSATMFSVDGLGIDGHVEDYWCDYGSTVDPYAVLCQRAYPPPPPTPRPDHAPPFHPCTGDYMKTSQYIRAGNTDGSTTFWWYGDATLCTVALLISLGPSYTDVSGLYGLREFFRSRGYSVDDNLSFNQRCYPPTAGGFTLANYWNEINNGKPVIIQLYGHSMIGFGYESTNSTIHIMDTWGYYTAPMVWGTSYGGMTHDGVTVLTLLCPPFRYVTSGTGALHASRSIEAVNTITSGQTLSLAAGEIIQLSPGVHYQPGSTVSVTINSDPCWTATPGASRDGRDAPPPMTPSGVPQCDELAPFWLYPNPSYGHFIISFPNVDINAINRIEIHDIMGRLVYQNEDVKKKMFSVDLSDKPKGMYFIKIFTDEAVLTDKVIIQ